MGFPSFLVILGQPNYCGKKIVSQKTHTRRVKSVQIHPSYRSKPDGIKRRTKEQMPRYDFALIEVMHAMYYKYKSQLNFNDFRFEPRVRPVCLPTRHMWKHKFSNQVGTVSGYERDKSMKILVKDQNACRLMQAEKRIIGRKDEKCSRVMFSYILIWHYIG